MQPTEQQVITATRRWVEEIVIGLNICPFAHQPFKQDTISYRVSRAIDPQGVYQDLLQALEAFLHADPRDETTGLFVCPDALVDFDAYNDFLDLIDDIVVQAGLEGWVQIASFHPDYRFADAPPDDPANYTNRSPYPMFHFIREEELAEVLESYPDPEAIPQRNVEHLRELGEAEMKRRLSAVKNV